MIHVDALDFSERCPEEVVSFFWRSVYMKRHEMYNVTDGRERNLDFNNNNNNNTLTFVRRLIRLFLISKRTIVCLQITNQNL